MPTPKEGYFLKSGDQVPGTTTVISRFKESGGLLQWAFKQGKAGKRHLYEEAEKAADVGTIVHAAVESYIETITPSDDIFVDPAEEHVLEALAFAAGRAVIHDSTLPPEGKDRAESSYNAFLSWISTFKVKVIAQEIQLVSEEYRFGGTPDAVGYVNGKLCLLDWKTSNSVYSDYLVQLAAYQHLWEINNPTMPITGGFHLLRFAKQYGDFAHHYYPELKVGWEQFRLFRQAFEFDKELKARAA